MPIRVQRKRTKGWRMPENTVSVTRPGKWGNPFVVDPKWLPFNTAEKCVEAFRKHLMDFGMSLSTKGGIRKAVTVEDIKRELRGKNLACFCPLDQPCHADVLLEIANG